LYRKLENLQGVFYFFTLNKVKSSEIQENNNLLLFKKMRYTDLCDDQNAGDIFAGTQ